MNKKNLLLAGSSAAVGVAVLVCAIVFYYNSDTKTNSSNLPPPGERVVKLVRVDSNESKNGLSYPGRIKAVKHAELFFRVSGPVIERNLKYGQTVEEGDVLMRIDPRDYQREVDRLTQELQMQKVQHSLFMIEFDRNKKLIDSKAISQATFDAVSTRKESSEAQLKMLEISLKIAKDRLNDTVLIAPFHGTISDLKIEQYEIAHANVPVVLLDDLREVEVKISVPAGNLPDTTIYDAKNFLGMKFPVSFPGRGERICEASIYEFKPVAAESSETYELTLRMQVPDDFLILPGMSAEVHSLPYFQQGQIQKIQLPFASIVQKNGESMVFVYRAHDGKLEKRIVKAGRSVDRNYVYVDGDIHPGELVVAAGADWLTEQTPVRVLNPEVVNENN